jgi:hypothetical protein
MEGLSAFVQLPVGQGETAGDSQMDIQNRHHFRRTGVCQSCGGEASHSFHKANNHRVSV